MKLNSIASVISCTPTQLASMHDAETLHSYIGYYTDLSLDAIAIVIGRNDLYSVPGTEIVDGLEETWDEWFENDPGFNATELAADMLIYTAWQIAYLT